MTAAVAELCSSLGFSISGSAQSPAHASSLLRANYSPMRGFVMLVDPALERAETELSNAVSTATWKPRNGEWLTFKSELESTGQYWALYVHTRRCHVRGVCVCVCALHLTPARYLTLCALSYPLQSFCVALCAAIGAAPLPEWILRFAKIGGQFLRVVAHQGAFDSNGRELEGGAMRRTGPRSQVGGGVGWGQMGWGGGWG